MSINIPRLSLGIIAIVSGIFLNVYTIVPHYSIMAYDRGVVAGMHPGYIYPGTPLILLIPPINYYLIAVGISLIALGIFLIASMLTGRRKVVASS